MIRYCISVFFILCLVPIVFAESNNRISAVKPHREATTVTRVTPVPASKPQNVIGNFQQRGRQLLLNVNRSVKRIEIYDGKRRIGDFPGGKSVDVTRYMNKAKGKKVTIKYHDRKGGVYSQSLAVPLLVTRVTQPAVKKKPQLPVKKSIAAKAPVQQVATERVIKTPQKTAITGKLYKQGKQLRLKTNRPVKKIEVYDGRRKVGELRGHRTEDISKLMARVKGRKVTLKYYDMTGKSYSQTLATPKPSLLAQLQKTKRIKRATPQSIAPNPAKRSTAKTSSRKALTHSAIPLRPAAPISVPPSPVKTSLYPAVKDQHGVLASPKAQVPDKLYGPSFIDLAIMNISISPVEPRIGRSMAITVTVKNIGLLAPTKEAYFQMEITDDPYMQFHKNIIDPFWMTIPKLEPNTERVITEHFFITPEWTWPNQQKVITQPGNYKILATINTSHFDADDEDNFLNNNQLKKTFTLRDPAPSDLVLDQITLTTDCLIKIRFHNESAAIPDIDFNIARVTVEDADGISQNKMLSDVDPTGLSKLPGNSWTPNQKYVEYTFPMTHEYYPELDIRLEPGETSNITVKLAPFGAIKERESYNNKRTKALTCPQ